MIHRALIKDCFLQARHCQFQRNQSGLYIWRQGAFYSIIFLVLLCNVPFKVDHMGPLHKMISMGGINGIFMKWGINGILMKWPHIYIIYNFTLWIGRPVFSFLIAILISRASRWDPLISKSKYTVSSSSSAYLDLMSWKNQYLLPSTHQIMQSFHQTELCPYVWLWWCLLAFQPILNREEADSTFHLIKSDFS